MIWEVLKKEIRSNIGSPKVVITYAVCAVLVLSAMLTGAVTYLSLKQETELQAAAEKERLRSIYDFNSDFLQQGVRIFRRPDVLSVLVSGVEGDAAQRGVVNSFLNPGFDVSKFNSTPILAVFGLLDLGFIVKIILSLFVILFTFDAISGEKELGTLKLNFANSVRRSDFIIGKLIGNFLLLLLPFIIPLLVGLLILQFIPGIHFTADAWIRLSLIVLAFVLYLLAFYGMGMMVSALTKRPAVSFLILLMLWVLFIVIVPRISVLAAQNVYPVPPIDDVRKMYGAEFGPAQYEFMSHINDELKELRAEAARREPLRPVIANERSMAEYEERMEEFRAWSEEARSDFMQEIIQGHEEFSLSMQRRGQEIAHEQDLKQERQNQLAIGLSRLSSPAGALTFAVNRLSKTGVYSSDKVFRNNVEAYLQTLMDYYHEQIYENPMLVNYGAASTEPMDVSSVYPDQSAFVEEPLDDSIESTLQDFAVLAILSIIFFSIAFVAFIRYDVR